MSRIRHATETFVNNLIEGIKKLIASNTEQINDLSNTKSEYIGKAFISEEILLDATYPIAYCGSVGNSSTMPNTGQFRVQYIPYFANNEGYSVQIAWGVVTNSGLWYRVASGTRWEKWESFSTTTKTDILQCLTGGWTVVSDCIFSAQKIGNRIFIEGIIQNSSPGQKTIAVGLPIPSDRKWHGGLGVGSNNEAVYMVVDPTGTLSFQYGGYTQGVTYSISIDYPV